MMEDAKPLGLYGASGILVAIIIIAGIITSSMHFPSLRLPDFFAADKGTLVIKLTDAPVDLQSLYVNISSLEALKVLNDAEEWIPLSFVDGKSWVYVDILTLQNVSMDLSITEIPPGNYTKLRMKITSAQAIYKEDTSPVELIVPPGKIDIIIHFEVKPGETTKILIDMEAKWVAISKTHRLRPVLKATLIPGE
jgi:hypothetical protein